MVDGDAWARSRKIKNGVEEKFRLHYTLWLTLAQANGTFECDLERIHADLYSFQLPSVKLKHVHKMFEQFKAAGVLDTWEERGKVWGFFIGSDKAGRLPSRVHLSRYKDLPPFYPGLVREQTGNTPEGFGVGVERNGVERNGVVQTTPAPPSSSDLAAKEADMKLAQFTKRCIPIWQKYFGAGAVLRLADKSKADVEFVSGNYDMDLLEKAFDLFAKDCFDNGIKTPYAVGRFMTKIADYMERVAPLNVSTALDDANTSAANAYAEQVRATYPSTGKLLTATPATKVIDDFFEEK